MKIADIKEVKMYTKKVWPYCVKAKSLLASKGLKWEEADMENPTIRESFMAEYPHVRTVPQIFINGNRVGGYDDLVAFGLE